MPAEARALGFAAIVFGNLALIFVNRVGDRSAIESLLAGIVGVAWYEVRKRCAR